jgi:hypothetical protein
MVQILSVAVFKANHPRAHFKLYADSAGFAFLQRIGLDRLYDSIDTKTLDSMPSINHVKFWAGSKIFAYQDALNKVENPIFIDIDAILWQPLDNFQFKSDIVAAHYETYNLPNWRQLFQNGACDDASELLKSQPYQLNASFLWFRNSKKHSVYCGKSIHYMLAHPQDTDLPIWAAMCYAEQVLLLDCCNKWALSVNTLGSMNDPLFTQYWTHLWAQKALFRSDEKADAQEANKILNVIQKYPNYFLWAKNSI